LYAATNDQKGRKTVSKKIKGEPRGSATIGGGAGQVFAGQIVLPGIAIAGQATKATIFNSPQRRTTYLLKCRKPIKQ
jgi:hypothetical protein